MDDLETFSKYINNRFKRYHIFKNVLSKILITKKHVCLNDGGNINLLNYFTAVKKLNDCGKFGEIYSACHLDNKYITKTEPQLYTIIKMIPIEKNILEQNMNTKFSAWREVKALKLVSNLVLFNKTIHFPILYGYYICNTCTYDNPHLKDESRTCIVVISEMIKYNLKMWLIMKKKIALNVWYNIYFQIIVSIYILQKNFQIIHNDLHWENILVSEIKSGGYWVYMIDGISYYLPNIGIIIKITDFGKCESITKFKTNKKDITNLNSITITNLSIYELNKIIDVHRISNIYNWIAKLDSVNRIDIPNEFYYLLKIIKNNKFGPDQIIRQYMMIYLNDNIGNTCTDKKYMIKNDQYAVGDIVVYNNIYSLITKIIGLEIYIITNKKIYSEIQTSNKDICMVNIKLLQQNIELIENKLGIYVL